MTTVASAPAMRVEGFAEIVDEAMGVVGWAIDRDDSERVLSIELWAGATRLAVTETGIERPDVCTSLGLAGRPGFSFGGGITEVIRAAAASGLVGDLTVRVADSMTLPGTMRPLELVRFGDAPMTGDRLAELLAIHARTAARRMTRPLSPLPDQFTGLLEALAIDEHGRIWITGWITEDRILDHPVLILDDGKTAAGLVLVIVRRDDLPPGNVGFVGVIHSDWRPSGSVAPYLVMGDTGERFIEPSLPTPLRSWDGIAPLIAHYLARSEGRFRDLLRDLFHVTPQWSIVDAGSRGERLQIDDVAILPGFGAFVTGWALSSRKEAESFTLKIGSTIIAADPHSITRHGRPDVASLYPGMAYALETAGFVATFRGAFDDRGVDDVILKAIWNDGSSTNDRATPAMIRILGQTAPIDIAQAFYPELEQERFFPDFARHALAGARKRARIVSRHDVAQCPAVLVLASPATASDIFLLYDNVLRNAALLPPDWGIAMFAASDAQRSMLVSLLADIRIVTGRPCSLFFARHGRPSTDALEIILDAVGAETFAWIDGNVILDPAGWRAIAEARAGLLLLATEDPASTNIAARIGLDAFFADRATWQSLYAEAPARIGGIALPNGVLHHIVPGAARSLGNQTSPAFVTRINRAVGHG